MSNPNQPDKALRIVRTWTEYQAQEQEARAALFTCGIRRRRLAEIRKRTLMLFATVVLLEALLPLLGTPSEFAEGFCFSFALALCVALVIFAKEIYTQQVTIKIIADDFQIDARNFSLEKL